MMALPKSKFIALLVFLPLVAFGGYLSELNQKALAGDASSQRQIETYFDHSDNDDDLRNIDEAIRCEIAAEAGNAEAQYTLGWFYLLNDNTEMAISWLEKSAEQNNIDAQLDLSGIYGGKYSDKHDFPATEKWLSRAIKQGSLEAQYELGLLYLKQKNHTKAFEAFRVAADKGYRPAKHQLAISYMLGRGTSVNPMQALKSDPFTILGALVFIGTMLSAIIYNREKNRGKDPAIFIVLLALALIFLAIGSCAGG